MRPFAYGIFARSCLQTLAGHTDRVWSVAYVTMEAACFQGVPIRLCVYGIQIPGIVSRHCTVISDWGFQVGAFDAQGDILAMERRPDYSPVEGRQGEPSSQTLTGHTSRIWSIAFHLQRAFFASW